MNTRIAILFIIILMSFESVAEPVKINIKNWSKYVPVVRKIDPSVDIITSDLNSKDTPFKTRGAVIIAESDLSIVGYSESQVKIAVLEQHQPKMLIEVNSYKSFEYEWINEDLLNVISWPGRCVNINFVYDFSNNKVVYVAGYQHCGLN